MANKIFNYRYRATAPAASYGTGNFNVSDIAGYGSLPSILNTTSGSQDRFTYSITTADQNNIYEYGIGYLTSLGGGLYQFVRETVLSSSQGDATTVNIQSAYGIITLDMVSNHPNYTNYKRINSNTTLPNINSVYFIDAATNLELTLPPITTDAVSIGFIITSLNGAENERNEAVALIASLGDGIDDSGLGYLYLDKKNDFFRIISDPETSSWIILDPTSSVTTSSGPNGAVQLSNNGSLGYSTGLFYSSNSLYIGGSGDASATTKLSSTGSIFNIQSGNIDFAVHSSGQPNTLFVDASTNSVGINTNTPSNNLDIKVSGNTGITISTETIGAIPTFSFFNNDPNFTDGLDIGRIDFIGTNTTDENIVYARIIAEANDDTDGSEDGLIKLMVNKDSSLQIVGRVTYDDIQLGPNNSISGGIIIGSNTTNKGDNISLGYYNSNCGINSINIGNQNTIESGAYACVVGTDHTVTGSYLWVFGGSGADIAGTNSTYLLVNDNNYIKLKSDQQSRASIYVDSTGTNFDIVNTRISLTNTKHLQNILFKNTDGTQVTGVSYGAVVVNPTGEEEETRFFIQVLESGSPVDILSISANNVNISNLSGTDGSVFIGAHLDVSGTGSNITVVGLYNTIASNSGENTIIGYGNELTDSGNDHITVVGNSNIVDENYSTTVGLNNSNSGLYSAVVGYNNGIYGENISVVGVNNDVSGNNSSAIGYQNNIDNIGVYIIGQGNTSVYSGVHILGNNVTATGHNTTYIKNQNVVITGDYITFNTTGTVNFNGTTTLDGSVLASSGDNISIFVNNSNYIASGNNISLLTNNVGYVTGDAYVTGISYDGDGELVLSTHSGTVTGILTDVAHSGDDISIFVNSAEYITSAGYANPKLTFYTSMVGTTGIRFSGAGTINDEKPDLYLYKGFTYDFNCNLIFPFQIQYPLGTAYTTGTINNAGVNTGIVSWTVKHDTPSHLYYVNTENIGMVSGNIYIV